MVRDNHDYKTILIRLTRYSVNLCGIDVVLQKFRFIGENIFRHPYVKIPSYLWKQTTQNPIPRQSIE